jgi:Tol biopolymer transport system component/regulation of enolase protein 1 (concanavalin A-like superfamily)
MTERSISSAQGRRALFLAAWMSAVLAPPALPQGLGLFEAYGDVGEPKHKGSMVLDAARGEYRLNASGENIWGARDAFHFAWKSLSGDLSLTAQVAFGEKAGHAHRKGGWMVRQGLEADAPYADAMVHADGLIALQYRLVKGGPTQEIQSPVKAPARIRLDRTGDVFSLHVSHDGARFQPVGAVSVPLTDPVQVGLAAGSHDAEAVSSFLFTHVGLDNAGVVAADQRVVESNLEVISIETGEREVVYSTRGHFEAPNWARDGSFVFNSGGRLYALARDGSEPRLVNTGTAARLNNDHGLSPDGQRLAISHSPEPENLSIIYVLPAAGGEPRRVTSLGPSYWHGWSPDGKTLAYCARRDGEFDVYTIAADAENSAAETRLTTAPGLDDGPDYSPDGQFIYFNSDRTGQMRIWRMKADGSDQQQMTSDEAYGDWFPHPSPDGKWLVFLSYDKSVKGHPPNKDVALRLMPVSGGSPRVLTRLFGGQGTINVPSWSPDSKSVAFVSYRLVKP